MVEEINDTLAYSEAKKRIKLREAFCRMAGHEDNTALKDPIERCDIIRELTRHKYPLNAVYLREMRLQLRKQAES